MKRSYISIVIIVALLTLAISGCTSPSTDGQAALKAKIANNPNFKIEVKIGNNAPVTVTWADIKALDFIKLDDVILIKSTGTTTTSDWIGPNMTKVLEKAGQWPAGDITIKIYASDGYNKIYTRQQVESAILALVEDDKGLTDNINKDSIRMVVPGEPGEMWMKCPTRIEISSGSAAAEPVALNITGKVEAVKKLTMSDLKSNPAVAYSVAYKDNQTLSGNGISLNKLLEKAVIKADATGITFIASDGYNKTVAVADITASTDAVIAFNDDGTLRVIIPGQPFSVWVGKLVTIEVV